MDVLNLGAVRELRRVELVEGIMRALRQTDFSYARVFDSHAVDYIWDGWAAHSPDASCYEDVRDEFEEVNVSADLAHAYLTVRNDESPSPKSST